jgi:formate/nitrite transporter FocA (FNT family)
VEAEVEEFRGHVLVRSIVCFLIVGCYVWFTSQTPDLTRSPIFFWTFVVTFIASLASINIAHQKAMRARKDG